MRVEAKGEAGTEPTGPVLWMPDNQDRAALLRQHLEQAKVEARRPLRGPGGGKEYRFATCR